MKMNPKQLAKWSRTRLMGRSSFVRRYGILGWGVPTAVGWSVVMATIEGWSQFPLFLVLSLIGFPIGGYFFGRFLWWMNETVYRRTLQA